MTRGKVSPSMSPHWHRPRPRSAFTGSMKSKGHAGSASGSPRGDGGDGGDGGGGGRRPGSAPGGGGGGRYRRRVGVDYGAPLVSQCAEVLEPPGAHPGNAEEAGRKKEKRGPVSQAVVDVLRESYYELEGFHGALLRAREERRGSGEREEAAANAAEEVRLELCRRVENRGVRRGGVVARFMEALAAEDKRGALGTWLRREMVAERPPPSGKEGSVVRSMQAMQNALRRQAFAAAEAEEEVGSLLIQLNEELHLHEDTEQALRSAIAEYEGMGHGEGWKPKPAPKLGTNHATIARLRTETGRCVLSMLKASPFNYRMLSIAAKKAGGREGVGEGIQGGVNAGRSTTVGPPSKERTEATLMARRAAFFVRERINVEMKRYAVDIKQRTVREKRLILDKADCSRHLEEMPARSGAGEANDEARLTDYLQHYMGSVKVGQKRLASLLTDIQALRDLLKSQTSGHARLQAVLTHELDDYFAKHGKLEVIMARSLRPARPFSAAGVQKTYLAEAERVYTVRLREHGDAAAIKIQSNYRGHKARSAFYRKVQTELNELAVCVIQRWFRGWVLRKAISSKSLARRIRAEKRALKKAEQAAASRQKVNAQKEKAKMIFELAAGSQQASTVAAEEAASPAAAEEAASPAAAEEAASPAAAEEAASPAAAEEPEQTLPAAGTTDPEATSNQPTLKERFQAKARTVMTLNRLRSSIDDTMAELREAATAKVEQTAAAADEAASTAAEEPEQTLPVAETADPAPTLKDRFRAKARTVITFNRLRSSINATMADMKEEALTPPEVSPEVSPRRNMWRGAAVQRVVNESRALSALRSSRKINEGVMSKLAALRAT